MVILALLLIVLVVLVIYGPHWWIRHVSKKYAVTLQSLPGTGAELARHLIDRFQLTGVGVEKGEENGDHFDPGAKMVRLSPSNYDGRSLTAVAVAAHEVGHAIQHHRQEPLMLWRNQYYPLLAQIERVGSWILMLVPLIAMLARVPQIMLFVAVVAIGVLSIRLLFHLTTLPVEWDASFGKALPILEQGDYLAERDLPAVRQVLKAAALTYVAGALLDMLRFWRWIRFLR